MCGKGGEGDGGEKHMSDALFNEKSSFGRNSSSMEGLSKWPCFFFFFLISF